MAFNYQFYNNSAAYAFGGQSGDMGGTYPYNAVMSGTTANSSAQVTAFQSPSGAASHFGSSGSNSHLSQIGASNAADSLSAYSQQHVYSPAFPNALALGSAGFDGGSNFNEVQRLHQYGSGSGNSSNVGTPYQTALRSAIETSIVGTGGPIGSGSSMNSRRNDSSGARFGSSYSNSSYGGGGGASIGSYNSQKSNMGSGGGMSMFPRNSAPDRWRAKRMEQKATRSTTAAQQFYCEVCRVACAGAQTYKEHLEGRQHKKKEAAARELERLEKAKQAKLLPAATGSSTAPANTTTNTATAAAPTAPKPAAALPAAAAANKTEFRCTLCEVACTGAEAYAAHMRGQKHIRTMRLHQKMGRPIPPQPVPAIVTAGAPATAAPVTTSGWVAGGVLKVHDGKMQELKVASGAPATTAGQTAVATSAAASGTTPAASVTAAAAAGAAPAKTVDSSSAVASSNVPIVGSEYIVQRTNDKGQFTGFECKLCECSFTDLNGRDMHLRGKRHRLAYRQKVDPHFRVPDANSKMRRDENRFVAKKTRDERVERARETHSFEQANVSNAFWSGPPGYVPPFGMSPFGPGGPYPSWVGYGLTRDDEYVQKRLKEIEPTEAEAHVLQRLVLTCERALKHVSDLVQSRRDENNRITFDLVLAPSSTNDQTVENESDAAMDTGAKKEESGSSAAAPKSGQTKPPADSNPNRVLKGVVRVGALANCLLRRGELSVILVVLCSEKPTRRLLQLVYDELPRKIQQVLDDENDEESYAVHLRLDSGEIIVCKNGEPQCECTIRLTSSLVREEALSAAGGQPATTASQNDDLLDRDRCLDALAMLRRAKWFQAKCLPHAPSVACLRLIRDLCGRVSTWQPLSEWLTALLLQRCAESAPIPPCAGQPSLLLRRFFELVSSGFLVSAVREPQRFTINDPCEKETINVVRSELTVQTAEDITASAQHALRLIAYHQMYKVINTEPITEEARTAEADHAGDGDAKAIADEQQQQGTAESMDTESTANAATKTVNASGAAAAQRPVPASK